MNIAITGGSGLVGSALTKQCAAAGYHVTRLVRSSPGESEAAWDSAAGTIDRTALEASDVVIHLAGESIGDSRWTAAKKDRIRESRVQGTRVVAEALAKLPVATHKTFLCASAVGFYGSRGDQWLDEQSSTGDDFLADVCRQWEAATEPAKAAGVRVVNLRFGVILSPRGGALAKMLLPFRLGVGGVIGSGQQYWSWVALEDVVGAIQFALATPELSGPVNIVSPQPATNREFTKALGRVLNRPTIFPMPAFAARLALGEMADALLLASQRVRPTRLESAGYSFRKRELEGALRAMLKPK